MKTEKFLQKWGLARLLTKEERFTIYDFFKNPKYANIIHKVWIRQKLEIVIALILLAILLYLFRGDITDEFSLYVIVIGSLIGYYLFSRLLKYIFRYANLKKVIFSGLMNSFGDDFKYALNTAFFPDIIEVMNKGAASLLESFDTIDYVGDSIFIQMHNSAILNDLGINKELIGNINIKGARIITSKLKAGYTDWSSSDSYETSNNGYFMKIEFKNSSKTVEKEIVLKRAETRGVIKFFLHYYDHILFVFLLPVFFAFIMWLFNAQFVTEYLFHLLGGEALYIEILVYIVFFLFAWLIYKRINIDKKYKHKLKLKDDSFDKIFDVFCVDENYYNKEFVSYLKNDIVKLLGKVGIKRNFEFSFFGNAVYVKYANFSVDGFAAANPYEDIAGYLYFYWDIHNIIDMALEMQQFYYKD